MSLVEEAAHFAVDVHTGMKRKGDSTPYFLHPFEVASIAATMTDDEEVLCAALLHDVVEDTPVTMEEIRERFGDRVALLVASETEDKRKHLPSEATWRTRKEESLLELKESTDPGVKIVWLADKLANMRSFMRMKAKRGKALWDTFNQKDPAQQAWYYSEVASLTYDLRDTIAWREYNTLTMIVFGEEVSP